MTSTYDDRTSRKSEPSSPAGRAVPNIGDELVLTSTSVEATERIGQAIGRELRPGHVVALIGPLGAGKTALVRGIAMGAGVADRREVASPTFVLVNEYEAPSTTIHHVDAYRLRGPADLEALGFDEMCETAAVLVEWADRVSGLLPSDHLAIRIEPTGSTDRRFSVMGSGPTADRLLSILRQGS